METKHTKGKWIVNIHNQICDSKGNTIRAGGVAIPMVHDEESIANTKLIAAAPELLEALIELNSLVERMKIVTGLDGKVFPEEIKSLNAINKATK